VPESRAWLASCVCVCGPVSAWHCHCGGLPNLTDGTGAEAEGERDTRSEPRRQMRIEIAGLACVLVCACVGSSRKMHSIIVKGHTFSFDTLIVSVACRYSTQRTKKFNLSVQQRRASRVQLYRVFGRRRAELVSRSCRTLCATQCVCRGGPLGVRQRYRARHSLLAIAI
jgi:hypothetical protein